MVGFINLRDGKGNFTVSTPLYVDVNDIDRQAFEESEAEICKRISSIMMSRYENEMAEFIANKKKEALNARKK